MEPLKVSSGTPTEGAVLPTRHERKRKRRLDTYERRCPLGWHLNPETVELLLRDPRKNDMVPGMIPSRYPIRMPERYVLERLASVVDFEGHPLIDRTLAASLTQRCHGNALSLRVTILGREDDESVPKRWLKMRLLGDRWKYNESSTSFDFGDVIVDVDVTALDVGWLGPSKRRTISEASVFVIMVEDLDGLRQLISDLAPCLKETYPEAHLIPPFLCFTSFGQEMTASEEETGKSSPEEEDVEQCFINAGLRIGLCAIPVNRRLRQLRDRLYRELCRKFERRSKTEAEDGTEDVNLISIPDPFEEAAAFLRSGLLVHRASSQC